MESNDAVKEGENNSSQQPVASNSACLANPSPATKFEQFKADSNFLREPLASEIENLNNHFSNDAVQLLKFHGSYQQDNRENRIKGKDRDWQMMLRLRSPGGRIPPSLFIALDDLSKRLGNGTLRATTRQAFQMHGIRKENIREVIGSIIKSMGSTLAACGDINRNVMAPAAPYDRGGYPAARELANEIADLLSPTAAEQTYLDLWVDGNLSYRIKPSKSVKEARKKQHKGRLFSGVKREPIYGSTYMPRKFKCAITVPGDNSVDLLTQDIGLVAFTNKREKLIGCNVYVGGGMGRTHNNEQTFARIAEPLGYVTSEDILELVQAILALQRDYGDRKIRKHARMKYLINDMGINWFKNELKSNYFNGEINELRPEPKPILENYLGWHKQSKRLWFVGIPLNSGRLNADFKDKIRKVIETYQLDIRLTPNQDILLCNIGNHQRQSIKNILYEYQINTTLPENSLFRNALACPALPLCGLAITEAERIAPNVIVRIEKLLRRLKINKSILIRMTGCPNGCARPYMAELGLVGSGVNQYQLWLGGSENLQRLARPYIQRMALENLEKTIEPLCMNWNKYGKKLSFGDYINQVGEQAVEEMLSEGLQEP